MRISDWSSDVCSSDLSIPYRHARGLGDVKYVWELNRLPHLQAMALLAALDRDAAVARRCVDEIDGWIAANPPFQGVNWATGIALALRLVSFKVHPSLLDPEAFPAEKPDGPQCILGAI